MKLVATTTFGLLIALAIFPAIFGGGDSPAPICGVIGGDMGAILQTIRTLESGGRYDANAPGSSASGAYQFTTGTWNGYGGYSIASDAPPEVQDAKAVEHVTGILSANGNDVSLIPVVWYIGHVPTGNEWDRVPFAGAGNVLTPRQYQTKWMTIYQSIAPASAQSTGTTQAVQSLCVGGNIEPLPGGWSLPGPRELLTLEQAQRPHHDYPAWDWAIPVGTPIYAVRGGTVTSITNDARNWFDAGCNDGGSCSRCGIGVTITEADGTKWTYCHGSSHTIPGPGVEVTAGTQIMWSGNSGRSTGPHLHLGLTTADGVARCPQPIMVALLDGRFVTSLAELVARCAG